MLSRVAERIYWLARYVERAENTARLVNVYANLVLDLPKGMAPGWEPLIAITGAATLFNELHSEPTERSVVRFLVGDVKNPSSILSSLVMARENARTIRDFVPRDAWELVNELHMYAHDNLNAGLSKGGRYAYLKRIILGAQNLTGLLAGSMNHDAGYDFLRAGRNLERADMTTRIVDVRSARLLPDQPGLRAVENVHWMSVLKSLTAYQMYRRQMQVRVRRPDVLRFLFQEKVFPRSVYHCLSVVETSVSLLPHNDAPLRVVARLKRAVQNADLAEISQEALHELIDSLQLGLGHLHQEIANAYFVTRSPTLLAQSA